MGLFSQRIKSEGKIRIGDWHGTLDCRLNITVITSPSTVFIVFSVISCRFSRKRILLILTSLDDGSILRHSGLTLKCPSNLQPIINVVENEDPLIVIRPHPVETVYSFPPSIKNGVEKSQETQIKNKSKNPLMFFPYQLSKGDFIGWMIKTKYHNAPRRIP